MIKTSELNKACYIFTEDSRCETGDSKFWGTPDLPEVFDWPVDADGYDTDFILQINLADLPFKSRYLPGKGMLYFFGSIAGVLGLSDEPVFKKGIITPGYFAVKYCDCDRENLMSGEITDEDGNPVGFEDLKIGFSTDESVCGNAFHQFCGVIPDDDGDEDLSDYSLLLCLDSFYGKDFTLEFENSGYLYFFIKNEDAEKGNFDNILCYLQ